MNGACQCLFSVYMKILTRFTISCKEKSDTLIKHNLYSERKIEKKIYSIPTYLKQFQSCIKGDDRSFSKWLPLKCYLAYTVSITTFYVDLWHKMYML